MTAVLLTAVVVQSAFDAQIERAMSALSFLKGSWEGTYTRESGLDVKQTGSVTFTAAKALGDRYIKIEIHTKLAGNKQEEQMHLVGYDPLRDAYSSWVFSASIIPGHEFKGTVGDGLVVTGRPFVPGLQNPQQRLTYRLDSQERLLVKTEWRGNMAWHASTEMVLTRRADSEVNAQATVLGQRLIEAIKRDDPKGVRELLLQGADPNTVQEGAAAVFHVHPREYEILKLLFIAGADPNAEVRLHPHGDASRPAVAYTFAETLCFAQFNGGNLPTSDELIRGLQLAVIAGAKLHQHAIERPGTAGEVKDPRVLAEYKRLLKLSLR